MSDPRHDGIVRSWWTAEPVSEPPRFTWEPAGIEALREVIRRERLASQGPLTLNQKANERRRREAQER